MIQLRSSLYLNQQDLDSSLAICERDQILAAVQYALSFVRQTVIVVSDASRTLYLPLS